MISPPLDGLYHYKRTVELSIESVRSAPHRVRFAPQNHPLYSADCTLHSSINPQILSLVTAFEILYMTDFLRII